MMEKLNILLSVSEYDVYFKSMKEELSKYANVGSWYMEVQASS